MQIQRTQTSQSAAGALLAALAKGGKTDGASFQQQFAETIEAVSPRRESSKRREEPVQGEAAGRKQKPVPRARDTARAEPVESPDRPERPARPEKPSPTRDASREETDTLTTRASSTPQPEAPVAKDADAPAQEQQEQPEQPVQDEQSAAVEAPSSGQTSQATQSEIQVAKVILNVLATHEPLAAPVAGETGRPLTDEGEQQQEQATVRANRQQAAAEVLTAEPVTAEETVEPLEVVPQVQEAVAEQAARSFLKARHTQVIGREESSEAAPPQRADAPQVEPAPEVAPRQDGEPQTTHRAAQNPVVHAQPIRAEAVSLQVTPTAPVTVEPSATQADESVARLGQVQDGPRPVAGVADRGPAEQTSADQAEQIERIAHVIRASISRGGSRVNLQLEPDELGRLRIQMQVRGAELTARFETETESARQWLQQGVSQLRDGLAAQGLRLVQATFHARGAGGEPAGSDAGGSGAFAGNGQAGGQQPQDQGAPQRAPTSESDVPRWTEVPAGQDQLNIVA